MKSSLWLILEIILKLCIVCECQNLEQARGAPPSSDITADIEETYQEGPFLDGSYYYQFRTTNGIMKQEQGKPKVDGVLEIKGKYGYMSPEGLPVMTEYIADEEGFRIVPEGSISFDKHVGPQNNENNFQNNPQDLQKTEKSGRLPNIGSVMKPDSDPINFPSSPSLQQPGSQDQPGRFSPTGRPLPPPGQLPRPQQENLSNLKHSKNPGLPGTVPELDFPSNSPNLGNQRNPIRTLAKPQGTNPSSPNSRLTPTQDLSLENRPGNQVGNFFNSEQLQPDQPISNNLREPETPFINRFGSQQELRPALGNSQQFQNPESLNPGNVNSPEIEKNPYLPTPKNPVGFGPEGGSTNPNPNSYDQTRNFRPRPANQSPFPQQEILQPGPNAARPFGLQPGSNAAGPFGLQPNRHSDHLDKISSPHAGNRFSQNIKPDIVNSQRIREPPALQKPGSKPMKKNSYLPTSKQPDRFSPQGGNADPNVAGPFGIQSNRHSDPLNDISSPPNGNRFSQNIQPGLVNSQMEKNSYLPTSKPPGKFRPQGGNTNPNNLSQISNDSTKPGSQSSKPEFNEAGQLGSQKDMHSNPLNEISREPDGNRFPQSTQPGVSLPEMHSCFLGPTDQNFKSPGTQEFPDRKTERPPLRESLDIIPIDKTRRRFTPADNGPELINEPNNWTSKSLSNGLMNPAGYVYKEPAVKASLY